MYGLLVVVIILLIYFVFSSKFNATTAAPSRVIKTADGKVSGVSDKSYMTELETLQRKFNNIIPRLNPTHEMILELEGLAKKYDIPIKPRGGFHVYEKNGLTYKTRIRSDTDEQDNATGKRAKLLELANPPLGKHFTSADTTNIRYLRFLADLIINHKYKDHILSLSDFDKFFSLANKNILPVEEIKPTYEKEDECEPHDLTKVKRIIPHKHPKIIANIYQDISPDVELSQATRVVDFSTPPAVRHLSVVEY